MTERPLPPPDAALQYACAAFANADALLSSARLLLSNDRWPHAYAFATLAAEEFGKGIQAFTAFAFQTSGDGEKITDFWKALSWHEPKLQAALGLDALIGTASDSLPSGEQLLGSMAVEASAQHQQKLRGLYVDLETDGSVRLPSEVAEEEARAQVERVGRYISPIAAVMARPETAELMTRPEVVDEARRTVAEALALADDPDGLMRAAHEVWSSGGGEGPSGEMQPE